MRSKLVRVLAVIAVLLATQAPAVTRGIPVQSQGVLWLKLDWVNSDVVACGAVTTCNILVGTLPAGGRVMNAIIRVTGAAVGPTTVTVSLGRTTSAFIDYIVASNAKAQAIYGDAAIERGTGLADAFFGDIPSLVSTTPINIQFVSTVANLSTVTGSAGTVWIRYEVVP